MCYRLLLLCMENNLVGRLMRKHFLLRLFIRGDSRNLICLPNYRVWDTRLEFGFSGMI
jgi:hypothetical protein